MNSITIDCRREAPAVGLAQRLSCYLQAAKPRIAMMAMASVAMGYALGSRSAVDYTQLASACFGIFCVAVACSLINQWMEQDTDRLMARTAGRPLVAGSLRPVEVFRVGLILSSLGITWLWLNVNVLTSVLAAVTLALYVCVYTPLKRVTCLCTTVGAVAGAFPPVLGWVAAGGTLDQNAWFLFLMLFAWQFPHFLAIATIYRDDYEQAGLKMLPVIGHRNLAGYLSVIYACALIPISLLAWSQDLAGLPYVVVAMAGGLFYLLASIRFLLEQSQTRARTLLVCSIVYLPVVLLVLTWDHFRLLS